MPLQKSTLQHLRFPFSLFLMPVYWFAISQTTQVEFAKAGLVFFILHFLVYPASNGFNSYYDKDEGSIGGVEKPLPVSTQLRNVSLGLDALALVLGIFLGWKFVLCLLIYGTFSKLYSHPVTRLKKYAWGGWLTVFIVQGGVTYCMVLAGIKAEELGQLFEQNKILPIILSSMLLGGSYPMTQIYQHEEDTKRGDITLSIRLGIRGTFYFTAFWFLLATIGFFMLLSFYQFLFFQIVLAPVLVYFAGWYLKVHKNPKFADFKHTMRLNLLSSVVMIVFFVGIFLWNLQTH